MNVDLESYVGHCINDFDYEHSSFECADMLSSIKFGIGFIDGIEKFMNNVHIDERRRLQNKCFIKHNFKRGSAEAVYAIMNKYYDMHRDEVWNTYNSYSDFIRHGAKDIIADI